MILPGDVLGRLAGLPDRSVQCCVTSPPYWGLRNYRAEGQLGLEGTLDCLGWATGSRCGECYICRQTAVFREVWRVLRDDGTLWLDIGDSYAGGGGFFPNAPSNQNGGSLSSRQCDGTEGKPKGQRAPSGLKPKDLCGVPWRLALSLQADGWYWRSAIVWRKMAPMPGSQRDRPTSSWEPVHLFSKSARYFYDDIAVREAGGNGYHDSKFTDARDQAVMHNCGMGERQELPGRTQRDTWWDISPEPSNYDYCRGCDTLFTGASRSRIERVDERTRRCPNCGRTDAWVSHYAAFPSTIPRRAILAGTSQKGACSKCGSPWERVVDKQFVRQQDVCSEKGVRAAGDQKAMDESNTWSGFPRGTTASTTTGWRPTCFCGCPDVVPCVCLDPYCGTGTSLIVARQLGREAIGIELSDDYVALANARLRSMAAQEVLAL